MSNKNPRPYADSVEFTLNDGQTDYDLDANQESFLNNFGPSDKPGGGYPTEVSIRTNQTITVKINDSSSNVITITSTDSPYKIEGLKIRNLYLTNASGSNAAIKMLFKEFIY